MTSFRLNGSRLALARNGITRRDLLQSGACSLLGMGLILPECRVMPLQETLRPEKDIHCILIRLHGGPSHLDTWDMKPNAPREFCSPFRPTPTDVQGMEISELFPRMARNAHLYSIVRSVYHPTAVANHKEACQAMQMKPLFTDALTLPLCGNAQQEFRHAPENALCSLAEAGDHSSHDLKMRKTLDLSHEPDPVRDKYGRNPFGQSCLQARRLVERGVRFVKVNMFEPRLSEVSWDAHGGAPFSSLGTYKSVCGPWFDNGYTSLIEELHSRGLYEKTIVIAMGEFGRTPRLNAAGGRDHWPHCFSAILGGGGIRGGQVVGASDELGAYPVERPTTPADLKATVHAASGIALARSVSEDNDIPGDRPVVRPLYELL